MKKLRRQTKRESPFRSIIILVLICVRSYIGMCLCVCVNIFYLCKGPNDFKAVFLFPPPEKGEYWGGAVVVLNENKDCIQFARRISVKLQNGRKVLPNVSFISAKEMFRSSRRKS